MSRFGMLPEALLKDKGLRPNEKLVLAVLLFHRNQKTGVCYPGLKRISEYTGLSCRTVQRSLAGLQAKGRIITRRRKTQEGDWDTNLYTVGGWCQSDTTYGQSDTTYGQIDTRGGVNLTPGWCQDGAQTYEINKREEQKIQPVQKPLENPPLNRGSSIDISSSSKCVLRQNREGKTADHEAKIKTAFEVFWGCYPKRQGKKAALKAFAEHFPEGLSGRTLDDRLQNLCGQAVLYAASVEGAEPKYIKNPANWLRDADPDDEALVEVEVLAREDGEPA